MSLSKKIILNILFILLYGTIVLGIYLLAFRPTNQTKIDATTNHIMTGQIYYRLQANDPKTACINENNAYYLVSGNSVTMLLPGKMELTNKTLSALQYSRVEVAGQYIISTCPGYMYVDTLRIIKEGREFAQEYLGELSCLFEGVNEEGEWCVKGLTTDEGRTYILSSVMDSDISQEFIGSRVRVLGIATNANLDVFEISKIASPSAN